MFVSLYMMNGDDIGKIEVSDSITVEQLYMMVQERFHYVNFKLTYNGYVLDEYKHHTNLFKLFGNQVPDNMDIHIVIKYTNINILNMQGKTIGSVQIFTTTTFKELYEMVQKRFHYFNFKLIYNEKVIDEYQHHTDVFQLFGNQVADNMDMYIVIKYTNILIST